MAAGHSLGSLQEYSCQRRLMIRFVLALDWLITLDLTWDNGRTGTSEKRISFRRLEKKGDWTHIRKYSISSSMTIAVVG